MAKPDLIDDAKRRDAAVAAAARALAGERDEHPPYAMLEQVVDRTADGVTREIVESHAAVCAQCEAELRDLREFVGDRRAPLRSDWLAAAAALLLAVLGGGYWIVRSARTAAPAPRPARIVVTPAPAPARDDWSALAAAALAAGKLEPPPILRGLRPAGDVLRDPAAAAAQPGMSPAGVVIESVTPALTWPAAGSRYVVSVFDGRRRVARSGVLRENEWRVSPPLARGLTYGWQVEVRRSSATDVLPAPPAPPVLFHVLDETGAAVLADARRRHRDDHLLIGVLYARMGMQHSAVDELRIYAAQHPHERSAAALADNVARW